MQKQFSYAKQRCDIRVFFLALFLIRAPLSERLEQAKKSGAVEH